MRTEVHSTLRTRGPGVSKGQNRDKLNKFFHSQGEGCISLERAALRSNAF